MTSMSPRTENACFERVDTFQDIFENATIGIFQTTPAGRYIRVNPALAKMYGYATANDMLQAFTDISQQLYVEPGRRQEFMAAMNAHGEIENFESQVRQRDGSIIWISESARVVRCDSACTQIEAGCEDHCQDRPVYYEGFVKNISRQKSMEAEISAFTHDLEVRVEKRTRELMLENERRRLAQISLQQTLNEAEAAVKEKAKFLATMTHELRTPLHAIIGYVQIIQADLADGQDAHNHGEFISIIDKSARHQLELINDILDLSKIDSGKVELDLEITDICDVIGECLDLIGHRAEEAGVEIFHEKTTDVGTHMQLDARRIKQVLLNLLSNAIKFTPRGGNVAVLIAKNTQDALAITVCDNGVGIAAEDIPKVLSEYGQAEHGLGRDVEGTGLGLPIAKKLVELHGGKLTMTSAPGKGTSVSITLSTGLMNATT